MSSIASEFRGVTAVTKANVYFDGKVVSHSILFPDGSKKTLGLIYFPEGPANCTFGGKDMKTLYVTAQTSLYTVKMDATGHRFAGK